MNNLYPEQHVLPAAMLCVTYVRAGLEPLPLGGTPSLRGGRTRRAVWTERRGYDQVITRVMVRGVADQHGADSPPVWLRVKTSKHRSLSLQAP